MYFEGEHVVSHYLLLNCLFSFSSCYFDLSIARVFMAAKVVEQEVTKVTPLISHSSSAQELTLPLTYCDILWLKFPPVERIFFYEITGLASDFFNSEIVPRLKHSLSLTLLHYLPLAGSIVWRPQAQDQQQQPVIYYSPDNDDYGVSVTVAVSSNNDFSHLSGNGIRGAVEFHPLVPQLSISHDKAEIVAAQITLFPDRGFSIGVSSHHAILDGKSTTMFVKSWAYLCKQLAELGHQDQKQEPSNLNVLPELLTPVFDRTLIKDPKGLYMRYFNMWFSSDPSSKPSLKVLPPVSVDFNKLVRASFVLTREDIKKLRDSINDLNDSKQKQLHLSTYVLTLAYAYVCIVNAKREEEAAAAANRDVIFGFPVDYRSRLNPSAPLNYFGNCVGRVAEFAKASDFMQLEKGFAFAVEKLSDLVKGIDADAFEGSKEQIAQIMAKLKQGALLLSVAGSTHFDVYGSDFGWGRPKKVEIMSIDVSGAVSLAESRDGCGGVEVGVVLEKPQMEAFASLFRYGLDASDAPR